jgi:hypothetical protein
MLYVGYPVYFETACTILNSPTDESEKSMNDRLNTYGLVLDWIDKGVCILGVPVEEIHISDRAYQSVDNGLIQIILAKKKVVEGLKVLKANLSRFEIAPMEEETIWVENPEPYLISTG